MGRIIRDHVPVGNGPICTKDGVPRSRHAYQGQLHAAFPDMRIRSDPPRCGYPGCGRDIRVISGVAKYPYWIHVRGEGHRPVSVRDRREPNPDR